MCKKKGLKKIVLKCFGWSIFYFLLNHLIPTKFSIPLFGRGEKGERGRRERD